MTRPQPVRWRATTASQRGSSHAGTSPNQDAAAMRAVGSTWVVAVSDGHGGARYVRSDVGAALAVEVAIDRVVAALGESASSDPVVTVRAAVPTVVAGWRAAVAEHRSTRPFTAEEDARAGRSLESEPEVAYGATLLVAIVGEDGVGVAQVGDGDALIRSHGYAVRPVPGDARLAAGQTTSLCLPTAVEDFRYAGLPPSAEADLVLLATDGYGNSFAEVDWWHGLLGDLASYAASDGFDALEAGLPTWLADSAEVGGDDVTAVVLVREPLEVLPQAALSPPQRPPAAASGQRRGDEDGTAAVGLVGRTRELPDHEAAAGSHAASDDRARRRRAVLAVLGVAVVVVTALVAVRLVGASGSPRPEEPVPPASTTTSTPTGIRSGTGGGRDDRTPPTGQDAQDRKPPRRGDDAARPGTGPGEAGTPPPSEPAVPDDSGGPG